MRENRPNAYPLRLDNDLSQWVKEQAKAEDRSFNAQVNRLIRQAKEAREQEEKQEQE